MELTSASYLSRHNVTVKVDEISQITLVAIPQSVIGDIRNGWFTQDQLNQAVADANTAKDLIITQKDQAITVLNTTLLSKGQTIAAMFTKIQLDQAVAEEQRK